MQVWYNWLQHQKLFSNPIIGDIQYDTEPWCFIDWVAEWPNKSLMQIIAEKGQLHERCDVSKIGAELQKSIDLDGFLYSHNSWVWQNDG